MKNNKGFTMVELLGVMVILAILSGVAIGAVYIYREKAEQQSYDTMAQSAVRSTENYLMDHQNETEVTLEKLMDGNYLERLSDPKDKSKTCTGKVIISLKQEGNVSNGQATSVAEYNYKVKLCCSQYKKEYELPSGATKDITNCS